MLVVDEVNFLTGLAELAYLLYYILMFFQCRTVPLKTIKSRETPVGSAIDTSL